ncbi:MAG: MlaD family protein, partial [Thermocrispum sp.]
MKVLSGAWRRTLTLVLFFAAGLAIYLYLLTGTGVRFPLIQEKGYEVAAMFDDVDNLVSASQVQMAGVRIGDVRSVEHKGDRIKVVFRLDEKVAPLHDGVTVRLGERSLIGESYLDIKDGKGESIAEGTTLPGGAIEPSTQLHDVLASLDADTRKELGSMVRSLAEGTRGSKQDISAAMAGLGRLGREGHTALDAIAAQSKDLRSLTKHTTTLLKALDTGEGQIATMVENAQRITKATSGQRVAVEKTMRELPGVLKSARNGSDAINEMSGALRPVAANLRSASPLLTDALGHLPPALRELRAMIPPFEGVLDNLPPTLRRVPGFDADVREMVGPANAFLRDLNPMLAYLSPYGPEFSTFFANYNSALQYTDEAGLHYIRLIPHVNEQSVQS